MITRKLQSHVLGTWEGGGGGMNQMTEKLYQLM